VAWPLVLPLPSICRASHPVDEVSVSPALEFDRQSPDRGSSDLSPPRGGHDERLSPCSRSLQGIIIIVHCLMGLSRSKGQLFVTKAGVSRCSDSDRRSRDHKDKETKKETEGNRCRCLSRPGGITLAKMPILSTSNADHLYLLTKSSSAVATSAGLVAFR